MLASKDDNVMTAIILAKEIAALPKSKQLEVMDFVVFLRQRTDSIRKHVKKAARTPLERDAFIGMWAKRSDLADSSAWVRKVRRQQWTR